MRVTPRIFIKPTPTDLRKGFNGLYGIVTNAFRADILLGDTFVFINRRRTLLKTLRWDGTGFLVTIKILAKGRFADLFCLAENGPVSVSQRGLSFLLSGAPLHSVFRAK